MKNISLIFAVFIGLVNFLSSCACTLEDCSYDNYPEIIVGYENIAEDSIQFRTIYIIEPSNFDIIDSIDARYFSENSFAINKFLMDAIFDDYREFKAYNYLLKSNIRQDTLNSIHYKRTSKKIDCNDCRIFGGDGSETITSFKDLEFKINNQLFTAVKSIQI
jgi:hypothetical protein